MCLVIRTWVCIFAEALFKASTYRLQGWTPRIFLYRTLSSCWQRLFPCTWRSQFYLDAQFFSQAILSLSKSLPVWVFRWSCHTCGTQSHVLPIVQQAVYPRIISPMDTSYFLLLLVCLLFLCTCKLTLFSQVLRLSHMDTIYFDYV